MTCRCRRSCVGNQCVAGYGIAFDGGKEKCSGNSVCCCGEECNKKEKPEDDSCDVGISLTRKQLPNVTTTFMTQCDPQIQDGARYDFVVFVDDSCGLDDSECEAMMDGAGSVILSLLNYPYSRVKLLQFGGADDGVDVLVDLDDELQLNGVEYVKYIRQHGQCKDYGSASTELAAALRSEGRMVDKGRNTKFVVISRCRADREQVCGVKEEIDGFEVDLYAINLMENRDDAAEYLLCLADDDRDRVCVGDHVLGDDNNGFGGIISDCLLPNICSVRPPVEVEVVKVVNENVVEAVTENEMKISRGFGDD